tara:strand:- start:934 stop:1905 length:972 start_codon:yes stop_codon:yes gene_type:complete
VEDDYVPSNQMQLKKIHVVLLILVATVIGVFGGMAGNEMYSEPVVIMPPPEVIKEELTESELRMLAEEFIATEADRAAEAIERVSALQVELDAKIAELAKLKGDKAKGSQAQGRLSEEISFLQVQLASAEEERNTLRKELKQAVKELDFQVNQSKKFKRKAKRYKMESTTNLWSAFLANAKIKICNRGTKKRHAKCHAAVDEALSIQMRSRFTVCVDTFQSVPVLKQAGKSDTLPRYSAKLSQDNKFTKKGWHVLFCDPTLPEARDQDLMGDDVATWKSTYGVNEELGLDDGGNNAPDGTGEELEDPIEDELDLDELDLDFGD